MESVMKKLYQISVIRRFYVIVLSVISLCIAQAALAALNSGDSAPDFTVQASLSGKEFTFKLAEALKKGPVVLYFYPAAFTKGCTLEAHEFATNADEFAAMGATILGMSNDTIETLNKFSVSECGSKFPVGADADQSVMKAYDAVHAETPDRASRTSYVISPGNKVIFSLTERDPYKHVADTKAAVSAWAAEQKAKKKAG
jgi:peroxiredoxin